MADLSSGGADVLVAYSTSRLTRRPLEYERLVELGTRRGLQIRTVVSGTVDLTNADGRATARILAAMDAAEAERIGERIARSKLQRAEMGLWHGGTIPPYGYDYRTGPSGRQIAVNPVRAAIVRDAAAAILAGMSLYRLCDDMNGRGLTTSVGGRWTSTRIRRILTGPAVVGAQERNGTLLPGTWTAILDRPTWDAVQLILRDPARNTRSF